MVRAFAATLLGVILRKRAAPLGPIMETRPVRVPLVHRQEGHAAACAHASRQIAVFAVALYTALPAPARLSIHGRVTRGQEGLRPPLSQA